MSFLDFLANKKIITQDQIPFIEEGAIQDGASLESMLMTKGLDPQEILKLRGEYLNIPTISIENEGIPFEILRYVPEKTATHYKIAPIRVVDGVLEVGMV